MTGTRIQRHKDLRAEMQAVARGEMPAPVDAGLPSFDSPDVLLALLTPQTRESPRLIHEAHPQPVAK